MRSTIWSDLLACVAAALAILLLQGVNGFPNLTNSFGDNDSMLRLVQIRDLLAGQSWFDMHQYRMGPEGGFIMHWSRIVDLPIAAIILAVSSITGNVTLAETVAFIVWPALLSVAALFLIVRSARIYAGPDAVLPALIIGAITLNSLTLFSARVLDHHNFQIVLALAVLTLLMRPGWGRAAGAGACAAIMLAIGMETAPFVAFAGIFAAGSLIFFDKEGREAAAGFGLGFAGAALIALVTTVSPSAWWIAQCDAYSARLGTIAMLAGAGLAALAITTASYGKGWRIAGILTLGAIIGATVLVYAPQCLSDPYAGLDSRLRDFWLDTIAEAQPLWSILADKPSSIPLFYATPVLAIIILLFSIRQHRPSRAEVVLLGFLVPAVAVSVWQIRGANFSLMIATIPLAGWIAAARGMVKQKKPRAELKAVFAWIASLSIIWGTASSAIADVIASVKPPVEVASAAGSASNVTDIDVGDSDPECYADATYAPLASQPATAVLAISNLGSSILALTPHRVLAGPYHRNVAGNLMVLDAFMGKPEAAQAIVRREKVELVAFCPGNPETEGLANLAPEGLLAELKAGKPPAWLIPVAGTVTTELRLYRVAPPIN